MARSNIYWLMPPMALDFHRHRDQTEMPQMKQIYAVLTVLGFALPLSQFGPWFLENGLDIGLFFSDLFANGVSGFFAFDVIVSAIVTIVFVVVEGARSGTENLYVPIAGTCLVGVSFGLPLFLLLRESALHKARAA